MASVSFPLFYYYQDNITCTNFYNDSLYRNFAVFNQNTTVEDFKKCLNSDSVLKCGQNSVSDSLFSESLFSTNLDKGVSKYIFESGYKRGINLANYGSSEFGCEGMTPLMRSLNAFSFYGISLTVQRVYFLVVICKADLNIETTERFSYSVLKQHTTALSIVINSCLNEKDEMFEIAKKIAKFLMRRGATISKSYKWKNDELASKANSLLLELHHEIAAKPTDIQSEVHKGIGFNMDLVKIISKLAGNIFLEEKPQDDFTQYLSVEYLNK